MNSKIYFVLATIFLLVAAFTREGCFILEAEAAEQSRLEQKQLIGEEICKLKTKPTVCAQACGGVVAKHQCKEDCKNIISNACALAAKASEQPALKKNKGVGQWVCRKVTETVCKWISCSGTGSNESQCREECKNIIVDSCEYI